jgi:acetyl-CoA carboxylase carboxyltransferase component
MSWTPELEELALRKKLSLTMGGEEKVKRQHDNGKLTVRERIDQLVDPQTFREVGGLAGTATYDAEGKLVTVMPSNVIIGRAQINQRPIVSR